MKQLTLISAFLLFSVIAFCQAGSSDQNYQKGKKAFKSGKYQEALAYLSISIGELPTATAFYYRSMTYSNLGDSCNSCHDLRKASFLNDTEYQKLFEQKCTTPTFVEIVPEQIKLLYPEVTKLKIIHYKCDSDTLVLGIIGQETPTKEIEIITTKISNTIVEDDETFVIVEDPPLFPGGDIGRMNFLQNNIRYPKEARNMGIQGTVYVSYVIDKTGEVTDIRILRGIGGGCDEEAIRVVKLMPKWKPGTQKGNPVRVRFNMPIKFTVQK